MLTNEKKNKPSVVKDICNKFFTLDILRDVSTVFHQHLCWYLWRNHLHWSCTGDSIAGGDCWEFIRCLFTTHII